MPGALQFNRNLAFQRSRILKRINLRKKRYLVITVQRPTNTDNHVNMENIIKALGDIGKPVIFPLHSRTRKYLKDYGLLDRLPQNITITEPLGNLDMLCLMAGAEKILTDSGGIQKEAYILKVPCITLRENTEWIETVKDGWNILTGADRFKINRAINEFRPNGVQHEAFGTIGASERIREIIANTPYK